MVVNKHLILIILKVFHVVTSGCLGTATITVDLSTSFSHNYTEKCLQVSGMMNLRLISELFVHNGFLVYKYIFKHDKIKELLQSWEKVMVIPFRRLQKSMARIYNILLEIFYELYPKSRAPHFGSGHKSLWNVTSWLHFLLLNLKN